MVRAEARSEDYKHYFNESYRLYGLVKKTNGKVVSVVEEAYGISGKEYNQYFGSGYFNTTEKPKTETVTS